MSSAVPPARSPDPATLLALAGICILGGALLAKACISPARAEVPELVQVCTVVAAPCMTCWWAVPGDPGEGEWRMVTEGRESDE